VSASAALTGWILALAVGCTEQLVFGAALNAIWKSIVPAVFVLNQPRISTLAYAVEIPIAAVIGTPTSKPVVM
jgi:hypothetical protein